MTPHFDGWNEVWKFLGMSTTLIGMAWHRKSSIEEDFVVSESARELIEGISDADLVTKVQNSTNINLRDQITVEEAEDWAKDRDLRGMRWRN